MHVLKAFTEPKIALRFLKVFKKQIFSNATFQSLHPSDRTMFVRKDSPMSTPYTYTLDCKICNICSEQMAIASK